MITSLTELSNGSVSGVKLVYRVDETPDNVAEISDSTDTQGLKGPDLKNW